MSSFTGNILVVDDSESMLQVMAVLFIELGLPASQVTCINNGEEALELLTQTPNEYSLTFIDLNMPNMDGMELIRLLGKQGYSGSIVIFSQMDLRIIDLATELASEHKARIIGNLSKPITLDKIRVIFNKLAYFNLRNTNEPILLSQNDIHSAVTQHQVTPYYQPIVNSKTLKISSMEVLARINIPGIPNVLSPASFIPTAKAHNQLDLLTFQLLDVAIREYPKIVDIIGYEFKLSVNLSAQQFQDTAFTNKLIKFLAKRSFERSKLILELTEENALTSPEQLETLNRLRIKGFEIALDDYGVGFTNVKQLRTLPFTAIKLDRSLISGIDQDNFSQTVVKSLVDISQNHQVGLVAEGLECFAELDYLQRHFNDILLQGYLISKPKPFASIEAWFKGWQKISPDNTAATHRSV